jgi:putative oxygen-independent coproporphyrinogen III oxidase
VSPAPPLALYVHWPYCARICPYCDFNVVKARGDGEAGQLGRAILKDIEHQAQGLGMRTLGSIFFGGGTPSLMEPGLVADVVALARRLWPPKDDGSDEIEVTLEANPTDAEAGRFAAFAAAGVGRLSLGVQSLDDAALRFLGRNHDAAQARRAAKVAGEVFPRFSIDLIYARPGQTTAAWRAELAEAVALGPEHISAYQLTIEADTAFDRATARGEWAPLDEETSADLYEAAGQVLGAAGFDAYEVSNHARGEAARSRHNLAYWRGDDYLGVGPGAHGRLTGAGGRAATLAAERPADYIARVEQTGSGLEVVEPLTLRQVALERLLMGLRTSEGVAWPDLGALGLHPDAPGVADLADGWLDVTPERLVATAKGRAVLDQLILVLSKEAEQPPEPRPWPSDPILQP